MKTTTLILSAVLCAATLTPAMAQNNQNPQKKENKALNQAKQVAKEPKTFDAGPGSGLNSGVARIPSATAPEVKASTGTRTLQQAITDYRNSGPAVNPQIQKAARPAKEPPAPAASKEPAKKHTGSGSTH